MQYQEILQNILVKILNFQFSKEIKDLKKMIKNKNKVKLQND